MKKYIVQVTEILQRQEGIWAKNQQDALVKMKEKYNNEEIVLDESNHTHTDFAVVGRVKNFDRDER